MEIIDFGYIFLWLMLLALSKVVKDILTPYKIDVQLTEKDNPALGLSMTGYYAAVTIIFLGATVGDSAADSTGAALKSMGVDLGYAILGIIMLNIGRIIVDKLVLNQFSTVKEIITDRNVGTGAVEFGSYVATALIAAGALHGEVKAESMSFTGGGVLTFLAFFLAGQITLVLFAKFYQIITKYDIYEQIEKDNVAAGVAFGANMVAIGIILLKATAGDFEGWIDNFTEFGIYAAAGFITLSLVRKITDWVLLPKSTLAHEIAVDRNISAAWIEGIVAISIATLIFFQI